MSTVILLRSFPDSDSTPVTTTLPWDDNAMVGQNETHAYDVKATNGNDGCMGLTVALVVMAFLFIFLLLLLIFFYRRSQDNNPNQEQENSPPNQEQENNPPNQEREDNPPNQDYDSTSPISLQEMKQCTNDFNADFLVGTGGFSKVNRGQLSNGRTIAIKKMNLDKLNEEELRHEIELVSKLRHKSLIALLGHCIQGQAEKVLAYEFMPQTLSRNLFNWRGQHLQPLSWNARLLVALDIANGLDYLHRFVSDQQSFIHRDLKSENILLDNNLHAKIADFGQLYPITKGQTSIARDCPGTFGNRAPEYAGRSEVSTKIDVYSFGIILMELITGSKTLDETRSETYIVDRFRKLTIGSETFRVAIDPEIILNEDDFTSISRVAKLAVHCTAPTAQQRPEISHVVTELSLISKLWKPLEEAGPSEEPGFEFDGITQGTPLSTILRVVYSTGRSWYQ